MHDWLDGIGLPLIVVPVNHDHWGDFLSAFESASPKRSIGSWQFIGYDDDLNDERAPKHRRIELSRFNDALGRAAPKVHLQHYTL